MKINEIRSRYLRFFKDHGHEVYESASLVPNDPTILFTVAGMVPFKSFFLGHKIPKNLRATSSQRCLRTVDIDIIGETPRHLTLFEMLGNFSFGDYFKREAIKLGWQFVTEELSIPKEKLIITVYEEDSEAYQIWRELGIEESHLKKLGKSTNFWETGSEGPCGPCSEIYYAFEDVEFDPDNTKFIEIYNLVFMEFNKDSSGKLSSLPKKNIDTGMGLERVAYVLQNVDSVFGIDNIMPIIEEIRHLCNREKSEKRDRIDSGKLKETHRKAERIIADHARAACLLILDNVLPSNEKRGYVLRRLIRRAVRYGHELGIKNFLYKLVPIVAKHLPYQELKESISNISDVIKREEEKFSEVIDKGLKLLEDEVNILKESKLKVFDSEKAFHLYDTYGFPFELTQELLERYNLSVSKKEFDVLFQRHQELSRSTAKFGKDRVSSKNLSQFKETEFLGYVQEKANAKLISFDKNEYLEMVFDKTPFYAESGGQVADRGYISGKNFLGKVIDVQKESNLFIHYVSCDETPVVGEEYSLEIDHVERGKIRCNHTATHLLHSAIKQVISPQASQAGSLVDKDKLRLDISWSEKIDKSALDEIERVVNREIFANKVVRTEITTYTEAKASGAIAYFEDKYGDSVRMVDTDFSKELCSGTHVSRTSEIGLFKIVSERSLSSNTRRIEAITNEKALEYLLNTERQYVEASTLLNCQREAVKEKIGRVLLDNREMKIKMNILANELLEYKMNSIKPDKVGNASLYIFELDEEIFQKVSERLRGRSLAILFSKTSIGIVKSKDLDIHVGNILKESFALFNKSAGGRDNFALAKIESKELKRALEIVEESVRACLK